MISYWIWLHELREISLKDKHRLLAHMGSPESLFFAKEIDYPRGLAMHHALKIITQQRSLDVVNKIIDQNERYGIKMITLPEQMDKGMKNKSSINNQSLPLVLYYRGNPVFDQNACAVVGSRHCSTQGYRATVGAVTHLLEQPICINSGLALGIDGIAHGTALKLKGQTQAFTAFGLDQCYPKEHHALMEAIIDSGAVLTTFSVGTKPLKFHFHKRNELMALYSDEVLVVEAGASSGALSTAQYARRMKKRVWVVPTECLPEKSQGNDLLKEKGAQELPLGWFKENIRTENEGEAQVLKFLGSQDLRTEELSQLSCLSLESLEQILFQLELNRRIILMGNGKWRRMR